ncbi:hypothetical protein CEXT_660671 [Caerostris extrusa]|uniref:Uncharacterized protein n=1 Tax=Caerostris extrusa TaxID=172846 RepID=A0AAV4UDR9_CAEEX|nr:hypothetical protein CEXT_660671 [Caerostris extrusa]
MKLNVQESKTSARTRHPTKKKKEILKRKKDASLHFGAQLKAKEVLDTRQRPPSSFQRTFIDESRLTSVGSQEGAVLRGWFTEEKIGYLKERKKKSVRTKMGLPVSMPSCLKTSLFLYDPSFFFDKRAGNDSVKMGNIA